MYYITDEKQFETLSQEGRPLLKSTVVNGQFIDAWFSERVESVNNIRMGSVEICIASNGLFGRLVVDISAIDSSIESTTFEAYCQIFRALEAYPDVTAIRFWNYVPEITKLLPGEVPLYHAFNAGRYRAFKTYYGERFSTLNIPAASAIGTEGKRLTIEFLAVSTPVAMIENKEQIPAYHYSEKYGKIPPLFSRGVIFNNQGQRLLLSSGTASVKGEISHHTDNLYEQLLQSTQNLRILGSQFNLKRYDIHYGFALEDIIHLRVYFKQEKDLPFLKRFIPKFLAPNCRISFLQAAICREELLVELEALFVKKGEFEGEVRPKYFLDSRKKIRTESFEVHIAEHCNLKCRDCCNLSPFNPKKFISAEEMEQICHFVKQHFCPDVFKIAGGGSQLCTPRSVNCCASQKHPVPAAPFE